MPRLAPIFLAATLVARAALAADPQRPTVVELYQSQGCSSCPPALANVNALADRRDVLALVFAVTYWDQLGWKDTFASPAYTQRQWDYAHAAGRRQVATPQTIVNGRAVVNGGNRAELDHAIITADRAASGPALVHNGDKVVIGAGRSPVPATVWLVRYDSRTIQVPVRAGENGGRTLAHRNVVRSLAPIGRWTGQRVAIALPPGTARGLRSAILVQQGSGGPIVAAGRL